MVYVVKTACTLESIVYCMYMYYLTTPSTEYTDGAPKNQKKTIPIASKENIRLIIFYLIGKKHVLFFKAYIHNSKYSDIIFYMTGKKHMFFSAGMPQPGLFLKKIWIVKCYMWSKCHLDMYFFDTVYSRSPKK